MGYTRYFTVNNVHSFEDEFVNKAKQIVSIAQRQFGVVVKGWNGHATPIINNTKISLNGNSKNDLACETLLISIDRPGRDSCKTRQYPYDMVVKAILNLAQYYGYVCNVTSDGKSLYDDVAEFIFKTVMFDGITTNLQDYAQFIELIQVNKLWPNARGQLLPISEMSVAHIKNAINLIITERWRLDYLPIFENELKHRIESKQFELDNLKKNIGNIS